MKLPPLLAFAAAGSLGALVGCVVINKDHCAYAGSACADGLVCSMCAVDNNGCVPPGTISDEKCLFLDGPSSTTAGGPTTEPSVTTGSTSTTLPTTATSTLDPTSTTGDPTSEPTTLTGPDPTDTTTGTATTVDVPCSGEVVDNPDCGGLEPYCVDMECVGCADLSSCAAVEPNKPTCDAKSGRCVECLAHADCTNVDKPACDASTATCAPCTEHEQCPTTACNLETGQCFPDTDVLYVYNETNICSDVKNDFGFAPATPICTLQAALKRVVVGKPTTIKLKNSIKTQSLPAGLGPGNFVVAIVPQDAQIPSLVMPNNFPALSLSAGNLVFMLKVGIYNNVPVSDPVVECVGARLWLENQRIYNTKTAIRATNCQLHLRRTIIFSNTTGGVEAGGTEAAKPMVWMENSFLTENNGSAFGGLRLQEAASAELVYTTVAINESVVAPIDCAQNWTGKLTIRNSALFDTGDHVGANCKGAVVTTTYTSALNDKDALMMGNVFTGFAGGFYQARGGGPLKDEAVWRTGDPPRDYNDTKRPTVDNSPDYAGADRPEG